MTIEPGGPMRWRLLPAAALEQQADAWDRLQRESSNLPFLETAFLRPLLATFGTGDELLALCEDSAGLVAAALVRPIGRLRWETFQPSQLPLGPWVVRRGGDIHRLAAGLLRSLPGFPLSLGLTQLDPKLLPRPADQDTLRTMDYVSTSCVEVQGDFDAYWEARGKNLRQNTRKQRNKLQAEGLTMQLECLETPADVADAIRDYGTLEAAGWKSGLGTAITADNPQGRFYTAMLEAFCAAGRGRIYRCRFGDKVVAMDLCIDSGSTVVILKTAYDEGFKQFSPSTLMRQDQFQQWWSEGRYRSIEFYGKTLEWHTRWTDRSRGLYHATAYRWQWVGRMAGRRSAAAVTEAAAA